VFSIIGEQCDNFVLPRSNDPDLFHVAAAPPDGGEIGLFFDFLAASFVITNQRSPGFRWEHNHYPTPEFRV
jgi:hypothetical protein